jgi:cell division transport system ATP-binding protein
LSETGVVRFENVGLRYGLGPEVLRDLTFRIEPHSFQFLTGPSGAGKTTLLRLMFLSLKPTRGLITQFGHDVATLSRDAVATLRRRIGVVFQDFRLLEHLTAVENVALPLRVAGTRSAQADAQVRELLAWVGLADHLDARPREMSGGQQQRVAIARAVITRPLLLLADEPTGNVDDGIGVRLMYLFEELNKMGTTVVIATHNEALVGRFTHRQLRITGGTVRMMDPNAPADGTPGTGTPGTGTPGTGAPAQRGWAQAGDPQMGA